MRPEVDRHPLRACGGACATSECANYITALMVDDSSTDNQTPFVDSSLLRVNPRRRRGLPRQMRRHRTTWDRRMREGTIPHPENRRLVP
jgi:hypothetical protein